MNLAKDLQTCPFCSGRAAARAFRKSWPASWGQVSCRTCGARGPIVTSKDEYDRETLLAQASWKWNERVG